LIASDLRATYRSFPAVTIIDLGIFLPSSNLTFRDVFSNDVLANGSGKLTSTPSSSLLTFTLTPLSETKIPACQSVLPLNLLFN